MKSANPHSGCNAVDISKCLDTSCNNPSCNQGGMAVVTGALCARDYKGVATNNAQVRRLTPIECARLQGFSDDYLDIQFRNKPAADSNKYKALGNSMAVPVMRYIGLRVVAAMETKKVAQ
jgi:site-specific DNA-cytosine methylase